MAMFDIIILAMVAGFILLRLRSELGNKNGNEPLPPAARPDPYDDNRQSDYAKSKRLHVVEGESRRINKDQNVKDTDPTVQRSLADIRAKDRYFNPSEFVEGAKSAYGMILEAFWSGDQGALKPLLSDEVYGQFSGAIEARDAAGHHLDNRILDIDSAKIITANLIGKMAELTVHFTSEIIAITKDSDGRIIEGNPSDTVEVNDKWTFARDLSRRDPSWTLVATRAG